MSIMKFSMLETYLKKVDMRMNYQPSENPKSDAKKDAGIRVNINISKGFNRLADGKQEMEITLDLHAIRQEKQFFQMFLIQAGVFEIKIDNKNVSEEEVNKIVNDECSQRIFPHLKKAVISLSKKSGFNYNFLDHIDLEKPFKTQENGLPQNETLH